MTIQAILDRLEAEQAQKIPSRFPCRAVMVKTLQEYRELLAGMKKLCNGAVASSSMLFSSVDVMPCYEALLVRPDKDAWIVLPGVSEYLRLFRDSEQRTHRFGMLWHAMQDAACTGRILIPLLDCEIQWFDPALSLTSDIRQEDYFIKYESLVDTTEPLNITVYSSDFEQDLIQKGNIASCILGGMQAHYHFWADESQQANDICLLTRQARHACSSIGDISVRVVCDRFAFIKDNLVGIQQLNADQFTPEMLTLLMQQDNCKTLDEAILSCLNIRSFEALTIMAGWKSMNATLRAFVRLWYTLHADNSYLCYCLHAAKTDDMVEEHILLDIFDLMQTHNEWLQESRALISIMNPMKDSRFFDKLDKLPLYEERLDFLTSSSTAERIYLLKMVGRWFHQDAAQTLSSEKLKAVYPALFAYLQHPSNCDDAWARYDADYKSHKLENSLPKDEEAFFEGVRPEDYPARYKVISEALCEDCAILWIDAMGAEWLSLLADTVSQHCAGKIVDLHVTKAILPTETCFNNLWDQMDTPYKKLNRLDKLAHKGVIDDPSYYTCVEEQISFVEGLWQQVNEMAHTYHRIIITGDHGTSRLAARFFHEREGLPLPTGAKACSHGRYAVLAGNMPSPLPPHLHPCKDAEGTKYLVYDNYDHFKTSGMAASGDDENAGYGEVHGGATPEELLVPVLVFDSSQEIPLTAKWKNPTVKIRQRNATAVLEFSTAVKTLQADINAFHSECRPLDDKTWQIIFHGATKGIYDITIVANGELIKAKSMLTIQSALGDDEWL